MEVCFGLGIWDLENAVCCCGFVAGYWIESAKLYSVYLVLMRGVNGWRGFLLGMLRGVGRI